MIRKIKLWVENIIRQVLLKILKEEYYISADVGLKETEILILKYSYRTGTIEIISDNHLQKTPLQDVEREIRFLAKKYNASVIADYPRDAKDLFNLRYEPSLKRRNKAYKYLQNLIQQRKIKWK